MRKNLYILGLVRRNMKRSIILGLLILAGSFIGYEYAHAISGSNMEIQSIDANFANNTAFLRFNLGQFVATNTVLANGDTVVTNAFVPSGESTTTTINGPAFTQIFGGLIQAQALNMDAVTNATVGMTGVGIAGSDSSTTIIPRPVINTVNLDELVTLKIQGLDWNTIKTDLQNQAKSTINWTAFNLINNTSGINWTTQNCNWNNWFTVEAQGVNWGNWQNSGCQ